jgi:hypothetical protein
VWVRGQCLKVCPRVTVFGLDILLLFLCHPAHADPACTRASPPPRLYVLVCCAWASPTTISACRCQSQCRACGTLVVTLPTHPTLCALPACDDPLLIRSAMLTNLYFAIQWGVSYCVNEHYPLTKQTRKGFLQKRNVSPKVRAWRQGARLGGRRLDTVLTSAGALTSRSRYGSTILLSWPYPTDRCLHACSEECNPRIRVSVQDEACHVSIHTLCLVGVSRVSSTESFYWKNRNTSSDASSQHTTVTYNCDCDIRP